MGLERRWCWVADGTVKAEAGICIQGRWCLCYTAAHEGMACSAAVHQGCWLPLWPVARSYHINSYAHRDGHGFTLNASLLGKGVGKDCGVRDCSMTALQCNALPSMQCWAAASTRARVCAVPLRCTKTCPLQGGGDCRSLLTLQWQDQLSTQGADSRDLPCR